MRCEFLGHYNAIAMMCEFLGEYNAIVSLTCIASMPTANCSTILVILVACSQLNSQHPLVYCVRYLLVPFNWCTYHYYLLLCLYPLIHLHLLFVHSCSGQIINQYSIQSLV